LPRPRIQLLRGTVPQKCVRNTLPARSGIPYRPASQGLRCRPLPTSSTRAPRGDTQLMWLRLRSISSVPTILTTRSAPRGVGIAHGRSEECLRRRLPRSWSFRVHHFRGFDSRGEKANPPIDLPQPPLPESLRALQRSAHLSLVAFRALQNHRECFHPSK